MADDISKVMLMYPNIRWCDWIERTAWDLHPYNLGILAATIKDKYDVQIFDANIDNLSKEDFSKIVEKEKPDILGISVLTNEYGEAGFTAAKIAKEICPNIKNIFGGVYATSLPEEVASEPSIDFIVIGEGEEVFPKLCAFLNGKGNLPQQGILYKDNGKIINTGRARFIENLDSIPYPAYDKFDFARYTKKIQREDVGRPRELPYARIMTSRGCPYNCCFCEVGGISGKKPRLRSLENILREIELLIKDYGIKSLIFDDDNLLMDKKRAKNLFISMIERKYNLKWNIPALAFYKLDEEMIKLMKESGCQFINGAIESGVERVLKNIIHKPLKLNYAKKMMKKIKEYNIDLGANFIIGFPGETWDEIRQTIKFAEEVDVDYVRIFIATPCSPNTELYQIAKKEGYLVDGFHFNQHLWTDGWIQTGEFRPQDLKILRAYEWDRINFTDPARRKKIARMMEITEKRLNEIRRETRERVNP